MPPKTKTPAPIDRPLSRAYLREFSGWSTAYPPGISEPTSLRIMENTQINRDGSVRVRPGLRAGVVPTGSPTFNAFVGTHETFFLNNATKAYLFAVREIDGTIGFRVWGNTGAGYSLHGLTDPGIGFVIPQGEPAIHFSSACSYVKYLQIDNKIFALSNSGEMMRYFTVGSAKTAKRLYPIDRPSWDVADKLTVVPPTQAWIASGTPIAVRYSSLDNQSFETNTNWWNIGATTPEWTMTQLERSTAFAHPGGGSSSGRLSTRPWIVNWMHSPMYDDLPGLGIGFWGLGSGTSTTANISEVSGRLRITYHTFNILPVGQRHFLNSVPFYVPRTEPWYSVPPLYWAAFDFFSSGIPLVDWNQVSCMVRFFNDYGTQIGGDQHMQHNDYTYSGVAAGGVRLRYYIGTIPDGATRVEMFPNIAAHGAWGDIPFAAGNYWELTNIRVVNDNGYGAGPIVPGVNPDAYWTGGANSTRSIFQPAQTVLVRGLSNEVSAGQSYTASFYLRAGSTGRDFVCNIAWRDSSNNVIVNDTGAVTADVNTAWTRLHVTAVAPPGAVSALLDVQSIDPIPPGEYHYVDHAMFERSATLGTYFDGTFSDTSTEIYDFATYGGTPDTGDSRLTEYSGPTTMPTAPTPTTNTLISSDATKNIYNFGFFYTFSNEVGESAASQVTVVKCQRGWSQWKWETANGSSEPSGTHTDDPNLCADQLVAYMPQSVFQDALDQGAIAWNLYALTWSDTDPVPVSAVRLSTRTLPVGAAWGSYGYQRMTPQQADANAEIANLPSEVNRFNYSNPSRGGNGLVAADRMVMVYDPEEAAVVRWSSNEMGKYSDFTANKGGGFKTLSSGNVNIPAAAVLWQNPQSADTITILCLGVDGKSTGYYMAPAQVASQSEAVNIMGFEETTATPGTTSPFGCEVVNNALYHPIDEQLMKSTATNYNINHSSMTDAIQDGWRQLTDMEHLVSAQHDNRIYYLVNNPRGAPREPGCWGNEVWVLDVAAKAGSWSRWLVQGHSLRRFEQNGQVVMSLVRPEGIYYFDESYTMDDYPGDGEILHRTIPWQIETNTQGANRAHDAWAHLQQANIVLGNFQGTMRYGVRGLDFHGKMQDVSKVVADANPPSEDSTAWDIDSYLLIRKDLKEWFFYAGSVEEEAEALPSSGQINLVQYRYTPSTVNTGYEYGSIETFEYARYANDDADRSTVNGVPKPMIDVGRP